MATKIPQWLMDGFNGGAGYRLTPAQIARGETGNYVNDGYQYTPQWAEWDGSARVTRNGESDESWELNDPTFAKMKHMPGTALHERNGEQYDVLDAQGNFVRNQTVSGMSEWDNLKDIAKAAAIVGGVGFGGAALMGGLGAAPVGAAANVPGMGGTFAGGSATGGLTAGAGAGSALSAAETTAALEAASAEAMGAYGGTATAGGGLLNLAKGAVDKYGKYIAPAAGALLGSQKNKASQSQTRTMDPRLDGPVYGEGGLVPRTQGLLAQQMSPEAQQGWLDMQRQGQGLLGTKVAPNGFGLFSNRR